MYEAPFDLTTSPPEVLAVRSLVEDEVLELACRKTVRAKVVPAELRTRHHEICRLLVMGYRNKEVAAALGYSEITISVLKASPVFQQLLQHYTRMRDAMVTEPAAKMHQMLLLGLDKVRDGMEGGELGARDVHKVSMDLADRLGLGPVSKQEKRSMVYLTAVDLERIKDVLGEEAAGEGATAGLALPGLPAKAEVGGVSPGTDLREEGSERADPTPLGGEAPPSAVD